MDKKFDAYDTTFRPSRQVKHLLFSIHSEDMRKSIAVHFFGVSDEEWLFKSSLQILSKRDEERFHEFIERILPPRLILASGSSSPCDTASPRRVFGRERNCARPSGHNSNAGRYPSRLRANRCQWLQRPSFFNYRLKQTQIISPSGIDRHLPLQTCIWFCRPHIRPRHHPTQPLPALSH